MEDLTKDTFQEKVLDCKDALVIVDFFAPWCGPCRMLLPILEGMEPEHPTVHFYKVNIDNNQDLVQSYGVQSIPTVLYFKGGVEVNRTVGVSSKENIEADIAKFTA